jgi:hypothetical protein
MGVSLFKMLDYPTLGYGLKNATTDEFFDLTGASITNNVLTLDMDIQTITYSITDKIIGDWQEPLSTKIYMTRQPVNSITSIITEDGTILENGVDYQFIKAEDPLLYGYSTKAKDYVIIENTTTFENFRVGTEESISFIGFYPYQLAKKGIDPFSIYVADFLTSEGIEPTIYRSSYENDPDYFIEVNNDGTISLTAIAGGRLNDNKVLLIEYTYNTNITITYQFNQIPINVQNQIDQFKHLTADVLVKDCIPVPVDMRAKVIINKGYRPAQIDVLIRTNIQNYITSLGLGSNLRVSDIVRTMSDVSGVAYIDLPFYQFAISENTAIIRESIVVGNNYTPISLLNSGVAFAWLIDVNLKHTAIDGGGSLGKVYANDVEMTLIPPNNRLNLTDKPFQVTIIGNSNLVIGGNPILNSANKILVSLAIGQSPSDYNFVVNYVTTTGTNVVHNISLPPFSYFKVGTLSFTYEEEI